ncbi:Ldh family oxidoreductase [Arthrobacter sp. Soil764]|uniref:Ldh family oxidoreductase n=1 Tax=Arthrobacter sp. Soil764 TaxID=1736403 RepID=UPI0007124891|nr:Ldh family oxidoreductase [Arthrobacter sp. Soil764]KRE81452.1 hypothetical protein ASG86_13065 [Arthrobacter sp. Soil764]
MKVSYGDVVQLATRLLQGTGLGEAEAASTARVLALAEAWDLGSHGLLRLPVYLDRLQAHGYNADAALRPVTDLGALLVLDGEAGMGHWQMSSAVQMALPRATEFGLCAVAVGNSSHCGALGVYAADAAEAGMVSLVFSSGPPVLPAWGGTKALLSTSPIAAGFPLSPRPAVIDLALSTVARGKIAAYAARGEELPEGWALDSDGQPTTDAKAALSGLLSPLGGAKGFALAYMVESLTAAMVGPSLSKDMPDFFDRNSLGQHQGIAHLLLMFDPTRADVGADPAGATRRIAELSKAAKDGGGRTPGTRRMAPSEVQPNFAVEMDESLWTKLQNRPELNALSLK